MKMRAELNPIHQDSMDDTIALLEELFLDTEVVN
jgi:hypothetical protein